MPDRDRRAGLLAVNLITASRFLIAASVAVLTLWADAERWAIIASVALVLSIEITDKLDGVLARNLDLVSSFGKMFDPYADSISRLTVFWSLAVVGRCWAVVPLIMAVRDVTVSYSRIVMTRKGMDVSARYTGKVKALVQGVSGLALMGGPLYWRDSAGVVIPILSGLVILVTVASMIDYGSAALKGDGSTSGEQDED